MTVLVLASEWDRTADGVVSGLIERGVPVMRVDLSWFPQRLTLSAEFRDGSWHGYLRTEHHEVDLATVRSVWVRTPSSFQMPEGMSAAEREFATAEAKYGLGGVLSSLPALWVNHPSRLADAAYKPVQLVTASRCGLTVPDTVITNEADTVREFAAAGKTVSKVFGTNTILEEGVRKIGFTRLLDDADLTDLRGINVTTHLVQRWVPKAHEVRMVVIGDHITAAAIRAGSPESYIDFRSDYDNLSYELIDPPADVVDGVRRLMVAMDLLYGALDFVVQPNGNWTFLEINAGGQFGFIEDETGAPLTAQLADLLAKGK